MADHAGPPPSLDDRAPTGIIEEQVGAKVSATTDSSNSVPFVGKEVLEQTFELSACHRVDGRHA